MEEIFHSCNPWWEGRDFPTGIVRQKYLQKLGKASGRKQLEVIAGGRRVGKTTILKQLVKELLREGLPQRNLLYLPLDHPRLLNVSLSEQIDFFRGIFLHSRKDKLYLFLDEVQESPRWEAELKAAYDLENLKIFCSGSTSSLIKSQGGKLTGRQIVTVAYPLSFEEYLSFKNLEISRAEAYKHEKLAEEYLQTGGYPEQVLNPSEEYMQNLLEDIIAKDLLRLFQIRRGNILRDLLLLLASSVGSRISFNKLARSLKISLDTVREYVGYLETAFLVKVMGKWSTSYTERVYASRKIYFVDTGFKSLLTGKEDLGTKAENAVFTHFLREGRPCGYYAESEKEMDFVLGNLRNPLPVEVKYVSHLDWKDKRLAGVNLFLNRFPRTKELWIISKDLESEKKERGVRMKIIPLWKFLLSTTGNA